MLNEKDRPTGVRTVKKGDFFLEEAKDEHIFHNSETEKDSLESWFLLKNTRGTANTKSMRMQNAFTLAHHGNYLWGCKTYFLKILCMSTYRSLKAAVKWWKCSIIELWKNPGAENWKAWTEDIFLIIRKTFYKGLRVTFVFKPNVINAYVYCIYVSQLKCSLNSSNVCLFFFLLKTSSFIFKFIT